MPVQFSHGDRSRTPFAGPDLRLSGHRLLCGSPGFAILLLCATLALACAGGGSGTAEPPLPETIMPNEVIPSESDAERTPDGLVRVKTPRGATAAVFVKPPRPHLQRYDQMWIAPAAITYKEGVRGWSAQDERQLRRSFRRSLLKSIDEGPAWKLAEEPGEGVLYVRVSLVDVDVDSDADSAGSQVTIRESGGGAIIVLELFDSATQEPLFRFIEKRKLPGGVFSGGNVDRERMTTAFRGFARDIGATLRNQYRIIREIERREAAAESEAQSTAAGN